MALITDQQIAQFDALGYFVTDPMFDAATLAEVTAEFHRLHAEHVAAAERGGDATAIELARLRPFIGQAHTSSVALKRFVQQPIYVEACEKLIGADADLYFNQAVIKPPEVGQSFAWHQDSGYVVTDPLEYITCWTAIGRSFIDNGCIWIIPESHKWGLKEHVRDPAEQALVAQFDDDSGAIPVEMEAGQVAIFSSLMLHRSGPNTSGEVRLGYVPQYHVPNVVRADTGEPFGDRHPVLRGGKAV